jgi:hypothetical protein
LKILVFCRPKTFKTFKTLKNGVLRARATSRDIVWGPFRRRFLILKSKRGEKCYRRADGFAAPDGQRAVAHKALGQRFALPTTPQAPYSSKKVFDWILKRILPEHGMIW